MNVAASDLSQVSPNISWRTYTDLSLRSCVALELKVSLYFSEWKTLEEGPLASQVSKSNPKMTERETRSL